MISEFEQRLADVLGARLPAPFTGRAQVAPGAGGSGNPVILVGAQEVTRLEPDFGSVRPERAPGSDDSRRVLRLRCAVGLDVHPGTGGDRQQQMRALDAALYTLDAPDFRNGSALVQEGDPGFLITELHAVSAGAPLDPTAEGAPPVRITLTAEGWFWPVGVTGETGRQIGEIRIRGGILPIEIAPSNPAPAAGGPAVPLTVRFRVAGSLSVTSGQAQPLPFGALALALVGSGGQPGAGTLIGGQAGTGGARLVPLTNGEAAFQYRPPNGPTTDTLVITIEDNAGGTGLELARFPLRVR